MSKRILTLILGFLFTILLVIAVPVGPHYFYGPVTIDGANAGVGATIYAYIGNEQRGSFAITTAGAYGAYNATTGSTSGGLTFPVKGCVSGDACYGSTTITLTLNSSTCINADTRVITDDFEADKNEFKVLAFTCTTTTPTSGATGGSSGGGGGGGGGGGAGGGGAADEVLTEITDPSIISEIQQTLPSDWTSITLYQSGTSTSKSMSTNSDSIGEAIGYATEAKAIEELQRLKSAIASGELTAVPTTTTLTVYKVKNNDRGTSTYISEIKITATAPKDMEDVVIIEVIPPTVAASIREVVFVGEQPEILQGDYGIIAKWTIPSMSAGQSKELKYFVKRRLASIRTMTLAGGKVKEAVAPPAPPVPTGEVVQEKIEKPIPWIGIIIVVAIVIAGLVVYLATRKKR